MGGLDIVSFCLGFLILILLLRKFLLATWWNPRKIEQQFINQGIKGPSYNFLVGSLRELAKIYRSKAKQDMAVVTPVSSQMKHIIIQDLLPHLHLWRGKYGRMFFYWFGPSARLVVTDPELVHEILLNTKSFVKSIPNPVIRELLGNGLLIAQGETWACHRKILNPFFNIESLKGYVQTIVNCNDEMIGVWKDLIRSDGPELEVNSLLLRLTRDIFARVAFQNKFKSVDRIVELHMRQMSIFQNIVGTVYIPGSRFLPTPFNIKRRMLRNEMENIFKEMISDRVETNKDKDLIGLMLTAAKNDGTNGLKMSTQEMIDECRTFFLGGFESISTLLTWACILMSIHTDWQDKARHEVEQVLQGNPPDYESLARLKILNMIVNETLRLYSPAPFTLRKVEKETKLGNIKVPAGTNIEIPFIAVHHDQQEWGEDVYDFNPDRFAEGVAKASKSSRAFRPFSSGERVCIGVNFSLIEAKLTLSMILQKFSFIISPNYKHSPTCRVTTWPVHGAQIIFKIL